MTSEAGPHPTMFRGNASRTGALSASGFRPPFALKWRFPAKHNIFSTPGIAGGKELAKCRTKTETWTSPTVGEGVLAIGGGHDQCVYAFA